MLKTVYVIVPVFNVEQYIAKIIEDILLQTYNDFELLLIDDGSNDKSLSICELYAKRDGRITIIRKGNGGVSSARNAGLVYLFSNNKKGYLTFVDADDWVDKDYFKKLVDMLETINVDIVCSSFNIVNGDYIKPYKHIDREGVYGSLEATRLLLRDESIQSHSVSKLFKLELWKGIRFNTDLFYMEDQETIYKVFYKAKNVYITNYAGYYYRQDNVNAVTKKKINNKKVISGLKGYYYPCLYDDFKKEDREYLLPSIHNALVSAYLMLVPYYKARLATDDEKAFIKELKKYIRDNKLIKRFVPKGRNNAIKKRLFEMCPLLYSHFFKLAKRIK